MVELLFKTPLLCSFCLQKIQNPIHLDCGHLICKKDFVDLKNLKWIDFKIFKCSECKKPISEEENKNLNQIEHNDQTILYDYFCSWCSKEPAKFYCVDVCNFLCETCHLNIHQNIKAFKTHSIIDLNVLDQTKFVTQNKCIQHQKNDLELYCKDCKIPLCTVCALTGKDKNHNLCSISDFLSEKNLDSQSKLQINLEENSKFLDFYRLLLEEKESLTKNYKESLQDIDDFIIKMIAELENKKKKWIQETNLIYEKKLDFYETSLQTLKSFINLRQLNQEITMKINQSKELFFLTKNFEMFEERNIELHQLGVLEKINNENPSPFLCLDTNEHSINKLAKILSDDLKILEVHSDESFSDEQNIVINFKFSNIRNLKEIEIELISKITNINFRKLDKPNNSITIELNPINIYGPHKLLFKVCYKKTEATIIKNLVIDKIKWKWDKLNLGELWEMKNDFIVIKNLRNRKKDYPNNIVKSQNMIKQGVFEIKIKVDFESEFHVGIGYDNLLKLNSALPQEFSYTLGLIRYIQYGDYANCGVIYKGTLQTALKIPNLPTYGEKIVGILFNSEKKTLRFYVGQEKNGVTLENLPDFEKGIFIVADGKNDSKFEIIN